MGNFVIRVSYEDPNTFQTVTGYVGRDDPSGGYPYFTTYLGSAIIRPSADNPTLLEYYRDVCKSPWQISVPDGLEATIEIVEVDFVVKTYERTKVLSKRPA